MCIAVSHLSGRIGDQKLPTMSTEFNFNKRHLNIGLIAVLLPTWHTTLLPTWHTAPLPTWHTALLPTWHTALLPTWHTALLPTCMVQKQESGTKRRVEAAMKPLRFQKLVLPQYLSLCVCMCVCVCVCILFFEGGIEVRVQLIQLLDLLKMFTHCYTIAWFYLCVIKYIGVWITGTPCEQRGTKCYNDIKWTAMTNMMI
jgi:hypothetical protein